MSANNKAVSMPLAAHRPWLVDVIEYLLHQACFLWWRLTGQLL